MDIGQLGNTTIFYINMEQFYEEAYYAIACIEMEVHNLYEFGILFSENGVDEQGMLRNVPHFLVE